MNEYAELVPLDFGHVLPGARVRVDWVATRAVLAVGAETSLALYLEPNGYARSFDLCAHDFYPPGSPRGRSIVAAETPLEQAAMYWPHLKPLALIAGQGITFNLSRRLDPQPAVHVRLVLALRVLDGAS